MKKLYVVLLALAVAFSFGADAMAKDGLSADLGFAWNFNGADMTKTIVKDGEDGANGSVLGQTIMAENTLLSMEKQADLSGALPGNQTISDVETNGGMNGLNIALRGRYDFMNSFFVRLGLAYDRKLMGGETSWKMNNFVAAGIADGSEVTQTWDYYSLAIPLTVGINIPVAEGKYNIYAGLGFSYYTGGWEVEIEGPAGYVTGTPAFKEKVEFTVSGLGFNYTIGANANVWDNLSVFIELDSMIAGGMSDVERLKTTSGATAFGLNQIAYPVNLSSTMVRFGVSYYIMAL